MRPVLILALGCLAGLLLFTGPAFAAQPGGWFSSFFTWNRQNGSVPSEKIYNQPPRGPVKGQRQGTFKPRSPQEIRAAAMALRAPQMNAMAQLRAQTQARLAALEEREGMQAIERQALNRRAFDQQKEEAQRALREQNQTSNQSTHIYLTPGQEKPVGIFKDYK